jgi:hypothetical protein
MKKFEYRILVTCWPSDAEFNHLGKDGWELVSVMMFPLNEVKAFFKREIQTVL